MSMEISNNQPSAEQVSTKKEIQEKVSSKKIEEKSTYRNSRDYLEYLNDKYACLTSTKDSSVSINSSLLSKAASNPKTAEWLEHTLSQIPDCISKICENAASRGSRLVSLSINIDRENCITAQCMTVCEADPETEEAKKMVEEARTRNKERKEEWKKMLEKKKENNAKQEKNLEKLQKKAVTADTIETLVKRTDNDNFWMNGMVNYTAFEMKA